MELFFYIPIGQYIIPLILIIVLGNASTQVISHRHLTTETQIQSRVVHVRSVVHKVAMGQVPLSTLQFSPVNYHPQMLHTDLSSAACTVGPFEATIPRTVSPDFYNNNNIKQFYSKQTMHKIKLKQMKREEYLQGKLF